MSGRILLVTDLAGILAISQLLAPRQVTSNIDDSGTVLVIPGYPMIREGKTEIAFDRTIFWRVLYEPSIHRALMKTGDKGEIQIYGAESSASQVTALLHPPVLVSVPAAAARARTPHPVMRLKGANQLSGGSFGTTTIFTGPNDSFAEGVLDKKKRKKADAPKANGDTMVTRWGPAAKVALEVGTDAGGGNPNTSLFTVALMLAFVEQESGGHADVHDGSAGEIGLMQVLPATGRHYGYTPDDLRDPLVNMTAGARIITDCLSKAMTLEHNDGELIIRLAAAMYNAGSGNVRTKNPWSHLPQSVTEYADSVLRRYRKFSNQ